MGDTTRTGNRRVLLFGMDGLRPDLVKEELMPNLTRLMRRSTRLRSHRTVFPSITRAVLSSINTGVTPGAHGMTSGSIRYDNATANHVVDSSRVEEIEALDAITHGRAIEWPSFGDYMDAAGLTMGIASAQSPGGCAIWSRKQAFPIVCTTTTYGRLELQALRDRLGPVPPEEPDNRNAQVTYCARAVAELFIPDPEIRLIVAWMAEPDTRSHKSGLGAPETNEALRNLDAGLGLIMSALDTHDLWDTFDLLLISDHGHATVVGHGSMDETLDQAKTDLGSKMPSVTHTSRNIYGMPNQPTPTSEELRPLIEWLQKQEWTGALFGGTDEISALPGMLSLRSVWNETYGDRAPLIATAGAWTTRKNAFGVPGTIHLPVKTPAPPYSAHGNLSRFELQPFAAFVGPDFDEDVDIETPTGTVDVLPTILHLLGLQTPAGIDGRVLTEVLKGEDRTVPVENVIVTPSAPGVGGFAPELHLWRVGHTTYIDRCENGRLA